MKITENFRPPNGQFERITLETTAGSVGIIERPDGIRIYCSEMAILPSAANAIFIRKIERTGKE